MPLLRVIVQWRHPNEPPRDICSNTLYFDKQAIPIITDYQGLVDDISEQYKLKARDPTAGVRLIPGGWEIKATIYNMSDPEPREPKAVATVPAATPTLGLGPREVALCLSYYGDRNLPRQRGRIYLGPFADTAMAARPTTGIMDQAIALGQGLGEIGGEDISWRVFSPTTNTNHHIRHIWVNNEWDTRRSRQLKETERRTSDV